MAASVDMLRPDLRPKRSSRTVRNGLATVVITGAVLLVLVGALGQRDAEVEHVRAALDLVLGDLHEAVVVVGEEQLLRLARALRVDALADERRRRVLHERRAGHHRAEALGARGGPLEAAVRRADIVSCATLATRALVRGEWLRPGTHLDLIGSFTPTMREADDGCFRGASIYVDTEEAWHKSGELIGPMSRGVFAASDVRGTLARLCRGEATARTAARERTVFKSVGTALEDLAAAVLVFESGALQSAAGPRAGGTSASTE